MPAVGNLLHEFGHVAVIEGQGWNARIYFNGTHWVDQAERSYSRLQLIAVHGAGPVVNLLIGCIGLIILVALRPNGAAFSTRRTALWIGTLMTWFFARFPFNFLVGIVTGRHLGWLDEGQLAHLLGYPVWSLPLVTAIAGFVACSVPVAFMWPRGSRLDLLVGASAGWLLGYWAWNDWIGPGILPGPE